MMTKIYFVRHAEPDIKIKDDMARPLTERGIIDSIKIKNYLENKSISRIYSSPFKRAVDTIKSFADLIGLEIRLVYDLRERNIGTWIDDFTNFAMRQWEDFGYKLEGGENLKEVQVRNINALYEILEKNRGENIVVGTHGTALSTIIKYFNPNFGYEDFERIRPIMPYIIRFEFDGAEFVSMKELKY